MPFTDRETPYLQAYGSLRVMRMGRKQYEHKTNVYLSVNTKLMITLV